MANGSAPEHIVCEPVILLVPSKLFTLNVKEALPVQPSALVTCTAIIVVVTRLKPAAAVSKVFVVTPKTCAVPLTKN